MPPDTASEAIMDGEKAVDFVFLASEMSFLISSDAVSFRRTRIDAFFITWASVGQAGPARKNFLQKN